MSTLTESKVRKVSYIDINIDPDLDRNPASLLLGLVREHTILAGRDGVFGGVRIPNNFMLPDHDQDMFFALGYEAAKRVASDEENFSAAGGYGFTMGRSMGRVLFTMDQPEHTGYRALVAQAFTHRSVNTAWLESHVAPVVSESISSFLQRGRGDLVQLFTMPYPYRVIAKITGVPEHLDEELSGLVEDALTTGLDAERAMQVQYKMDALFLGVIKEHRLEPQDDLIGALINAELDGEKLSDADISSFLRVIVAAGLDTTYRGTGTLIYHLLTHPDQFEELKRDRSLVESAIWESLRVDAPGGIIPRIAKNDVEIDGVKIPKGSGVICCLFSANYDPRVFEDPATFNIKRTRRPIMTFGAGPHSCLGNNLARLEMKFALTSILDRLPLLRKDEEHWPEVELRGFNLRSPTMLPVLWDGPTNQS